LLVWAFLLGLQACALAGRKEFPRLHPARGSMDPAVASFVEALLGAWGRLDMESVASSLAPDYRDAQGRTRGELLRSLEGDKNNFTGLTVSLQNAYSQTQQETLAIFDFTLRANLKAEHEVKLTGRAEWVLAPAPGGGLRLLQARGSRLLGLSNTDSRTLVLENVFLDGAKKKKVTAVSGAPVSDED